MGSIAGSFRSVLSYVQLAAVSERIINSSVYQGFVGKLTLSELSTVIDKLISFGVKWITAPTGYKFVGDLIH